MKNLRNAECGLSNKSPKSPHCRHDNSSMVIVAMSLRQLLVRVNIRRHYSKADLPGFPSDWAEEYRCSRGLAQRCRRCTFPGRDRIFGARSGKLSDSITALFFRAFRAVTTVVPPLSLMRALGEGAQAVELLRSFVAWRPSPGWQEAHLTLCLHLEHPA